MFGSPSRDDGPCPEISIPPALVGALLLLTVLLAGVFIIAANVVQTP